LTQRPDQQEISGKLADQDQQERGKAQAEGEDDRNEKDAQQSLPAPNSPVGALRRPAQGFDWLAFGVVLIVAAFFALTARFNVQPAASFVPIAVLSATGCGLLVTALRKTRAYRGAGVLEAALGGLFLALLQFAVALTYPGIFDTLTSSAMLAEGFLTTWGLVAVFSVVFSIAGAAIGHLAFAPVRPLPVSQVPSADEDRLEEAAPPESEQSIGETEPAGSDEDIDEAESAPEASESPRPTMPVLSRSSRPVLSTLIAIVLLGLIPIMAGYVFAAAYDFTLNAEHFSPGIYPTLRLLSGLLPWQVAIPINLSGANANFILFVLLWRIPLMLGNAGIFDVQALEPYIFNGAALALLLLTLRKADSAPGEREPLPRWPGYLLLEAMLGLALVVPANIWIERGLEGLLQFSTFVIPLHTLQLLDPLTFALNFVTGPLVCVLAGLILRRQYVLWTSACARMPSSTSTSI
jgi:hypothetical protein